MSEGGFLLVTRAGKIWKAPWTRIISAGEPIARPAATDRASFINVWCKDLVTTFALNSLSAARDQFRDRDRGMPFSTAPPTPPGIRVRTTAVRLG